MEAEFYTSKGFSFGSVSGVDAIVSSQYGTSDELNEQRAGYPVLRLNEFDLAFIGMPAKFANLTDDDISSLRLAKDDVLICRTNGNPHLVGRSALVPRDYDFVFASYLFRVRPRREIINSATLVAFLNSKFGRAEIERYSMLGNQANFSPAKFRQIKIPLLGDTINKQVEGLTYKAYHLNENSKLLYAKAEDLLLSNLELVEWYPTSNGISVKSFSDVVSAGRIDAEYFQPKFDEIKEKIYSCSAKIIRASELLIEGLCKSDGNQEERYVELADIGSCGAIESCTKDKFANLPSRARQRISSGQVIVSSIEGSLKSCALVTDEYDGALCSTGFYRFQSDEINPEALLLLFKSWPIQKQLKRGCSGTILSGISSANLSDVVLPVLSHDIQLSLAEKVRESFRLRQECKRLLDLARVVVEKTIEDGEDAAIRLIEEGV